MTREEFQSGWEKGKEVKSSFEAEIPTPNFSSFPEAVTAEHTDGVFYGVHFAFSPVSEFRADYETCMFSLDTVGDIERRKQSHGEHVYLVKMFGDEVFPVFEVENGQEYRTLAGLAKFKKI